IENFISLDIFRKITGNIMRGLRNSKKAPGCDRIYTAGEKEFEAEMERCKTGIPINEDLQQDIKIMQEELRLMKYNFPF
ncbi:unnamed protein product, partial [marine sediment metagenome]